MVILSPETVYCYRLKAKVAHEFRADNQSSQAAMSEIAGMAGTQANEASVMVARAMLVPSRLPPLTAATSPSHRLALVKPDGIVEPGRGLST
jgi:hypothetical protein